MRRRHKSARQGAAAVEFALVAPFLILMLMGMIEFGRVLIIQQSVTTAAREACREATLPDATMSSTTAVANQFASSVPSNSINVTCTPTPEDANAGELITVDVEVSISAISKMGEVWFGSESSLTATAAMRKEGFE